MPGDSPNILYNIAQCKQSDGYRRSGYICIANIANLYKGASAFWDSVLVKWENMSGLRYHFLKHILAKTRNFFNLLITVVRTISRIKKR